jgi:hypothetical protein
MPRPRRRRVLLERQARFLDRLGKWLRRRGKPLAYLWVVECRPWKGRHTHLLLASAGIRRDLGGLFRRLPEFLAGRDGAAAVPPGTIEASATLARLP